MQKKKACGFKETVGSGHHGNLSIRAGLRMQANRGISLPSPANEERFLTPKTPFGMKGSESGQFLQQNPRKTRPPQTAAATKAGSGLPFFDEEMSVWIGARKNAEAKNFCYHQRRFASAVHEIVRELLVRQALC